MNQFSKYFIVLFITFLYSAQIISAETKLPSTNNTLENEIIKNYESIPDYEKIPFLNNYWVNQPLTEAIRFGCIGTGSLTAVYLATAMITDWEILSGDGWECVIIPAIGFSIGSSIGLVNGFFRANKYSKIKKKTSDFHLKKRKIGNELAITGRHNQMNLAYLISIEKDFYSFDEILFGFESVKYGFDDDGFEQQAHENKIKFALSETFFEHTISPFFNIGAGISRGNYTFKDDKSERMISFFAFIKPGITVNIYDLCYVKVQAMHEFSYFYKKHIRQKSHDVSQTWGFSIGTKIF